MFCSLGIEFASVIFFICKEFYLLFVVLRFSLLSFSYFFLYKEVSIKRKTCWFFVGFFIPDSFGVPCRRHDFSFRFNNKTPFGKSLGFVFVLRFLLFVNFSLLFLLLANIQIQTKFTILHIFSTFTLVLFSLSIFFSLFFHSLQKLFAKGIVATIKPTLVVILK